MDELAEMKEKIDSLIVTISEQEGQLLALGAVFTEQLRYLLADDPDVRDWFIGRLEELKVRPSKSPLGIPQREAMSRGHARMLNNIISNLRD